MAEKVKKIHEKSRGTYGARCIRQELAEGGESVSHQRIGRLMK
ncbi:IS3 family transposase [Candidatus Endoriftia persephonae]|uniref:IS3 family transposase n=1 Tax=Candidatus Endoriftia persephonae TaxID=393765 RepID=A0A9J6ZTW7_9GAMM|nr:IS3 family transposase [Candidatus Endoriftia persephone]USF86220.1 IS3 family transposase [Candidatus Endoriftia persephone]